MKFIYILRHAKTIHGGGNLKDFDRYLTPEGYRQAVAMANKIHETADLPQLLIASPARRAEETAKIFAEILGYSYEEIIQDQSLYFGDLDNLLEIVRYLPDSIDSAMIIGHNPTVLEAVNFLSRTPVHHFPPCSLAGIQLQIEKWQLLKAHCGIININENPSENS